MKNLKWLWMILLVLVLLVVGIFIGASVFKYEFPHDLHPYLAYNAANEGLCTPDNAGLWTDSVTECEAKTYLFKNGVQCKCLLDIG